MSDQPSKISKNPPEQNPKSTLIGVSRTETAASYSGPIPPPSMLASYNEILPGAADRILKMAEDQSKHRQDIEKKVIDNDILTSRLGVVFGFLIAISFLIAAVIGALSGHPVFGGLLGTGGLTGLVSVFIYGTKSKRDEREKNKKQSIEPPHK